MDLTHHGSQEQFFSKLTELLDDRKNKTHGSIYLMQKRLNPLNTATSDIDSAIALDPFDLPALPLAPVLIRANNGKGISRDPKNGKITKKREDKVKLSTIVQPDDLDAFYTKYAEVCRSGMTALKKRDKKKSTKKKGKAAKSGSEEK